MYIGGSYISGFLLRGLRRPWFSLMIEFILRLSDLLKLPHLFCGDPGASSPSSHGPGLEHERCGGERTPDPLTRVRNSEALWTPRVGNLKPKAPKAQTYRD